VGRCGGKHEEERGIRKDWAAAKEGGESKQEGWDWDSACRLFQSVWRFRYVKRGSTEHLEASIFPTPMARISCNS